MTEALKELWALAFGDSWESITLFFQTAYHPRRCRLLTDGDRVCAALHWLDCEFSGERFAYIYAVATHPDDRGRGLCRQLMKETHQQLRKQGYAGAVLMPAEAGLRQMYAKMGYRECSSIHQFDCHAGKPVAVRSIDRGEYARLRRQFLPANGLIQEKENLAYLETYAGLYAGKDFLLAAVHEEDRLFGMELLGNAQAAPGILGAMGYREGTFRTPGDDIPFGMGISLKDNVSLPGYLGLAFD